MGELSSASSSSPGKQNLEQILENWFNAIIKLQTHYNSIHTCIEGSGAQRVSTSEDTLHVGQCPVSQLESLLVTIQEELEKLRQEMEQLDDFNQNKSRTNYIKLIDHTLILNHLNDQAKIRLTLASRPAS